MARKFFPRSVNRRLVPALLVGLSVVFFFGPLMGAAQTLEEIKVTADFRGTAEFQTPTSVAIIDETFIRDNSAMHLDDLLNLVPNLNFAGGTSRSRFFQIRGIGERSQFSEPLNPSVGFIVDGVDFSGVGSIGTLLDVAQVEVLRGPQGTRYGANALAGLIYLKTRDPEPEPSLDFRVSTGDYGHRTIGLVVNQPLGEMLGARLVLEQQKSNGYYSNSFLGVDDTNERDEFTGRLKLRYEASDNLTLLAGLSKVELDNGYDTFSLDNDRSTRSDEPGRDTQDATSLFLQADWRAPRFDMQMTLARADSELEYSYDEDWTFTGFHPFGYTSFDRYLRDKQITSFETRLLSNQQSRIFAGTTDWLVGVYRLDQKEDLTRAYTFLAAPFTASYDFTTSAVFFQMDTKIGEDWQLAWGGRVEQRDTQYRNSDGFSLNPDETLWGGELALKRRLSARSMAYVSLARGYKAGGFNTDGSLDPDLREFSSEYLWELEIGVKSQELISGLYLGAAVFYDQRRDQQVKSSLVRSRPDGSTEFIDFLGNAAEGTNRGLEITARYRLNSVINLQASAALLDAAFDRFINEFGEDLSGRDQAQAPGYSYQFGINMKQQRWQGQIQFAGKDDFYFSDRHGLRSTPHHLLNAGLTVPLGPASVSLWGRNLTDRDYTVRGFGSFGNDPRNDYATEPYVQYGEPRMVGITFTYRTNTQQDQQL